MKLKNLKRWGTVVAAGACLALTSAKADIIMNVGLTDPYAVGDVVPGVDYGSYGGQAAGDLAMINQLAGMALSSSASVSVGANTYLYNRSGNFSSPMGAGTLTGNVIASGGGINFDGTYAIITLTSTGFGYLVAKYDGPNGGAEVWNISGIAAGTTIKVPEYAFGQQVGQYQMTGWGLFNPTTPPSSVADGGTTMVLLGAALSGLGLLRRKLS